jgi:type III secretion system low calcium response chaperone LcrH/SycD
MAMETNPDARLDQLLEELQGHFRQGGTLGDLQGFEDKDYEAIYAVGHGLYTQGKNAEASKVFGFLMMHNPYDRRFPIAMGAAQQMLGKFADAIGFYALGIVLDMSDPVPLFHTAECLAAIGERDDARDAFNNVITLCNKPEYQALREKTAVRLQLMQASAQETT